MDAGIGFNVLIDGELAEEASVQTLVRALEEIGRIVVVDLPVARHELIAEHLKIHSGDGGVFVDESHPAVCAEISPAARRDGRGTATNALATEQRTRRNIVVALQNRFGVGPFNKTSDVSTSIERRAAECQ